MARGTNGLKERESPDSPKGRPGREQRHREQVEAEKRRIRSKMNEGFPVYGAEWRRVHERRGNFASADALGEMLSSGEIQRHNRAVGKGDHIRERTEERRRELVERERERNQKRDRARAERELVNYRRDHPAPNPNAIGDLQSPARNPQPGEPANRPLMMGAPKGGWKKAGVHQKRGRPPWA